MVLAFGGDMVGAGTAGVFVRRIEGSRDIYIWRCRGDAVGAGEGGEDAAREERFRVGVAEDEGGGAEADGVGRIVRADVCVPSSGMAHFLHSIWPT
jgi:hypothetical protein